MREAERTGGRDGRGGRPRVRLGVGEQRQEEQDQRQARRRCRCRPALRSGVLGSTGGMAGACGAPRWAVLGPPCIALSSFAMPPMVQPGRGFGWPNRQSEKGQGAELVAQALELPRSAATSPSRRPTRALDAVARRRRSGRGAAGAGGRRRRGGGERIDIRLVSRCRYRWPRSPGRRSSAATARARPTRRGSGRAPRWRRNGGSARCAGVARPVSAGHAGSEP